MYGKNDVVLPSYEIQSMRSSTESEVLKQLGQRLRDLRVSQGLTQEELAAQVGFTRSYYTEVETGKRNISVINLINLSRCLGVSVGELFNLEEEDK